MTRIKIKHGTRVGGPEVWSLWTASTRADDGSDLSRKVPFRGDHSELSRVADARAAAMSGELPGLKFAGRSPKPVDQSGANMSRHVVCGICPVGQERECAVQMVEWIAERHGPGDMWIALGPSLFWVNEKKELQVLDIEGIPHVFMRAYYSHSTLPLPVRPAGMVMQGDRVLTPWPADAKGAEW